MKLILLTDVKGRGNEGDVVDVAQGFAVNFLLPRKMAVAATPGNLKQLEARKHNIRKREGERHEDAEKMSASVNGKMLIIEAKAGEEGKLYGSVTSGAVAAAIADQLGLDIDRRKLDIQAHIKSTGEYPVTVHLYMDVKAEIIVKVVPLGGTAAALEAAAAPEVEEVEAEVVEVVVEADEAAAEATEETEAE
jgi:large subunit ribosomal protein L9